MKRRLYIFSVVALIILSLSSCERKSGRRNGQRSTQNTGILKIKPTTLVSTGKTIIKMTKKDGVYMIPVDINDVEMFFIFDTGAGLISISETEASFLYKQGKLTDEDFIGTANFVDANGDISEGTIIMLKSVKIGDRVLSNIEASVVHNMKAPLLFGQSALEKFGKISIDYNKGQIIFE